ncbi:MAG: IS3 family transposase [SAR324 cluster bacterium]|nr:IS3 family transposase [SAR324 cluster bacterium]
MPRTRSKSQDFIKKQSLKLSVTKLCDYLEASRSGYYRWIKAPLCARKLEELRLKPLIIKAFTDSKRIYGSPRVHAVISREGIVCVVNRVARLMKELGLRSLLKKKYRVTTNSKHNKAVAQNILNRKFYPLQANQAWVGDITYIWTGEGWLYLAVVIDLHSRKVTCWSMSEWIKTGLIQQALAHAVKTRQPSNQVLFHSDRGVQYASDAFQKDLKDNNLLCSMSRKGNCWDNAVVESFFKSLKQEWLHQMRFKTRQDARGRVFDYIECFYNPKRLHSTLGYLSPVEFETVNFI